MGVFVRHDTAFLLAEWSGWTPSAVFYVLGGFWEATLCAVLFVILCSVDRDVWTDLAKAATVIGFIEAAMVSGCKLAITSPPPRGVTNCQHLTGLPIGSVVLTLEIMALCWVMGSWIWNKDEE